LYFPRFAGLEYLSYQMIWKYEAVWNEFKKCAREHLNNPEIEHRLYREGLGAEEFTQMLREVVYPIYCSAKTCGFSSWEYEPGEHELGLRVAASRFGKRVGKRSCKIPSRAKTGRRFVCLVEIRGSGTQ